MTRVQISDDLKTFLEGPVSVLVGTRDSRMVPEITRGWGPSVSKDRHRVAIFQHPQPFPRIDAFAPRK